MSQCDLCGRNEAATSDYTIYSAKPAGPAMTTSATPENMPTQVIVTRTKPYKEFATHHYLICKRCKAPTFIMAALGILFIVSAITLGVLAVVNKKSVTASQFLTVFAIYFLVIFASALVGHFIVPDKRLKRKAIRSRGKAFEFGAWTEKEFEQVFGKHKPD